MNGPFPLGKIVCGQHHAVGMTFFTLLRYIGKMDAAKYRVMLPWICRPKTLNLMPDLYWSGFNQNMFTILKQADVHKHFQNFKSVLTCKSSMILSFTSQQRNRNGVSLVVAKYSKSYQRESHFKVLLCFKYCIFFVIKCDHIKHPKLIKN